MYVGGILMSTSTTSGACARTRAGTAEGLSATSTTSWPTRGEQGDEPLAHEEVVLDHDHAHGISMVS